MSGEAVLVALAWVVGWVLLASVRTPRAVDGGDDGLGGGACGAGVVVVVPARDEAANLPTLLGSLARQSLGPVEVVVVDDGSVDGTGDVARSLGATVLQAPVPPVGWAGKPWACWIGAGEARERGASTVVFLDADTELASDGLERIVAEHRRTVPDGLLSVQPHHRTGRPHEQLSAFGNIVSMMASGCFGPVDQHRSSVAFGPCLVTSLAAYDAVGGHRAVAGEVIEDLHLARRYRDADLPVRGLAGGTAISYRMYPEGLGQLIEGWSKGLSGGARLAPAGWSLGAAAWVTAACTAATGALTVLSDGLATPDARWSALVYLAFAVQVRWALVRIGRFAWWVAPLFPVALAGFVACFARSLVLRLVVRRVRWRGRHLRVAPVRG